MPDRPAKPDERALKSGNLFAAGHLLGGVKRVHELA
jgi:hypothetical protein